MNPDTLLTLFVFGSLAHLTATGWTLAHCLGNCNAADKTAYAISIIFFPIGWIIYWLLKPYAMTDEYRHDETPKENTVTPFNLGFQFTRRPRRKKEIDYTEELLKPHTIAPCERQVIAEREAAAAHAHALTSGQVKPHPTKPIHIIAQERKITQAPFPTS
jgi:hypothetical protein